MGNCAIGGKTNWFITETSMNSILVFLLATKSQALEFEKSLLTPAAVETKGNIQSFFLMEIKHLLIAILTFFLLMSHVTI